MALTGNWWLGEGIAVQSAYGSAVDGFDQKTDGPRRKEVEGVFEVEASKDAQGAVKKE